MGLLLLQGSAALNPRELFANGEQGLWLDPSQMSTLYQDSNGVTPCTAAGDPVGLILDQSRGGLSQIGADLVTNGTFAADSDWTKGANWTIGSGVATKTGGAANNLTQTIGSTAAAWYRISLDVTRSAGALTVSLGTSGTTYAITSTGSYTFFILAGSGTQTLTLAGDSSFAGTVDNVVVKNVPGNHAYQTTSASRPTLARIPVSGRRNLLTRTEEFDNAAWTLTQATISANATTAPDNTSTADKLISSAATAARSIRSTSTFSAGTLVCSVYVKAAEYSKFGFREGNTTGAYATFNLATGAVVSQGDGGTGSITSIGNGWYRCSCAFTSAGSVRLDFHPLPDSYTSGRPDISFAGDGTSGVFLWGAQLETGSTATNYQKVVATTDVTESGVGDLWHLVFDGSDDSLVTNSISFDTWTQETRRNLLVDTESLGTWVQVNTFNGSWVAGVATVTDVEGYTYGNPSGTYNTAVDHVISFDVVCNQTVSNVPIRVAGTVSVATLVNLTAGVTTRITLTGYRPFAGSINLGIDLRDGVVPGGSNTTGYTVTFSRAQMEIGTSATTYQRVGTDEMTVIAGVRKLSDAASAVLCEFTADYASNNGSFVLFAPLTADPNFTAGYKGSSTSRFAVATGFSQPITRVVTGLMDISDASLTTRVNGVSSATNTNSTGSGNFANSALYIGRRNQASLPLNGHIYQLIVRGKTTPTGKLLEAERFVGRKTGVSF